MLQPGGEHWNPLLEPGTAAVFCLGTLTSMDSSDGKLRGIAVATLQLEDVVWGSKTILLGESVTKFDAQLAAFRLALSFIGEFLKVHD
jgi:hypothetical protein